MKIYREANLIFDKASMRLHKWVSNSDKMRAVFTHESTDERPLGQTTNPLKVLGLMWETNEDCLTLFPGSATKFAKAQAAETWPFEQHADFILEELEERKEIGVLATSVIKENDLTDLTRFSSATNVKRVTGWIFRFLKIRTKDRTSGPLTAEQIEHARVYWLERVQSSAFALEFERNASGGSRNSPLKDFQLWTGDNGLLRIRGRLCSHNMTEDERQTTPGSSPKTTSLHAADRATGPPTASSHKRRDTLVQLRGEYWTVRGYWRIIVEHAPWWEGFYEQLVRSVKTVLKKAIGHRCLGYIELSTILAEVGMVINSRPLTHVHDDPNNGPPLTPTSFLTGKRLTALPAAETES
ncbi:hypothetical protein HPB50_019740 [Hyalomma asiaticum]|uniref:Uncharacterized protein n=1 Tax=Hyalomma asiaticum TaxID=266040 RepID=A0ACB7TJ24_HYAAI|nr:hypothetical protein HPB50_019740 [Hyalomma asiaticum]